jgi:uncharacterized protein (DUF1810 family)
MKNESHSWDLSRFLEAQSGIYETALDELRSGRKESHWMWFVFPQLAGLGASEMAQRYAISSLEEAKAYLAHPVLGDRLRECTRAVLDSGENVSTIFPYPDDLKFRSCATLFAVASGGREPFAEALRRLFQDHPDHETLKLLGTVDQPFSNSVSNPIADACKNR